MTTGNYEHKCECEPPASKCKNTKSLEKATLKKRRFNDLVRYQMQFARYVIAEQDIQQCRSIWNRLRRYLVWWSLVWLFLVLFFLWLLMVFSALIGSKWCDGPPTKGPGFVY